MNTTAIGKACKFNICFRDVTLTAQAGIVLVRDFIERLGVPEILDAEVQVKARQRGYPESENLLNLCWNALLGGSCLLDLNVLRGDAGLPQLLGVAAILAPTTAGEFLRQFTLGDLWDLQRAERRIAQAVRSYQNSDCVTMDLDASLYAQAGTQKQGVRMNYKGEVGYYPLFIFWAEQQELLATHLLAGNKRAAPKAVYLLQQALRQAPTGKKLSLRGDSEFYCWDLLEFCEAHEPVITYAITADQTPSLQAQIAALPEPAWRYYAPGQQVAQLWFAPQDKAPHRYLVKRHWVAATKRQPAAWRYHAVITNDHRRSAKKLLRWALGRCAMENLIKEHKHDFGFAKMPTNKYHANWAWLLISQLAWNLLAWFKRYCLPPECHPLRLGTLRQRLLKVTAKIVQQGRQLFLVLSDTNYYQDWWSFALKQLAQLVPISP